MQNSNTLPSKEETPSVFTFTLHLSLPLYQTFTTEAAALSSGLEKIHTKGGRSIFRLVHLQLYTFSSESFLQQYLVEAHLHHPIAEAEDCELLGVFLPDKAFFTLRLAVHY